MAAVKFCRVCLNVASSSPCGRGRCPGTAAGRPTCRAAYQGAQTGMTVASGERGKGTPAVGRRGGEEGDETPLAPWCEAARRRACHPAVRRRARCAGGALVDGRWQKPCARIRPGAMRGVQGRTRKSWLVSADGEAEHSPRRGASEEDDAAAALAGNVESLSPRCRTRDLAQALGRGAREWLTPPGSCRPKLRTAAKFCRAPPGPSREGKLRLRSRAPQAPPHGRPRGPRARPRRRRRPRQRPEPTAARTAAYSKFLRLPFCPDLQTKLDVYKPCPAGKRWSPARRMI